MAEAPLFRMPDADQRKRREQQHRHNLRIAIRQLERAELYLVALYSLYLEDRAAEATVDDLIQRLHALEQHLIELKRTA